MSYLKHTEAEKNSQMDNFYHLQLQASAQIYYNLCLSPVFAKY